MQQRDTDLNKIKRIVEALKTAGFEVHRIKLPSGLEVDFAKKDDETDFSGLEQEDSDDRLRVLGIPEL